MPRDPAILAHQEWLGYVQPVGLVVSIPAMLDANARINQNVAPDHRRFIEALPTESDGEPIPQVADFPHFAQIVLGWSDSDLYGAPGAEPLPENLEVPLPDYNETLRPTYALREFEPTGNGQEWILLVKVLPTGADFDAVEETDSRHWQASPQAKFERLLRQTKIPIGLLFNGRQIRLVHAPEKELSGSITFNLAEMVKVAGRPIFAAFHMLLSFERLYSVAERERLPAILENSRKYQNVVSTQLASQVLEALYELLRGFQAADDQAQGALLREVLAKDPDHVYRGLLTTLLRMVFVLYAEDRGLLSTDPVFANYYSITGLYERLRIDDGRYPDTMDQRYGAWAQLLTLFRLIYRGGSHADLKIPAREGYLFDPDRYLFLEGRLAAKDAVGIPRVPDGVLFRVLSKLMLLDGERISYRTLAVEQIGSVYEAIMGFELHVASGPSIAIKPVKRHGAPTTINLEALLHTAPDKRLKSFADETDQKLTGKAVDLLRTAATVNDLMNALEKKIASAVTPGIVAKGAMIFQPSNERRRSGSHYTPSSLTGPIVQAALEPVLKQLGDNPTPAQILNLKVCDPAMGSGAFLVEACRQLGDALSRAWNAHNERPILPPDEDEELHAQRQIAQRCLYGVDKNPMATDLTKLSLWLATLAKDHPFTFLDHALRSGDSLVGLSRKQITAFHWDKTDAQQSFLEDTVRKRLKKIGEYRQRILDARDLIPYAQLEQHLEAVDGDLGWLRRIGDTVIAAFFSAEKPKAREATRQGLRELTEKTVRSVIDLESNAKIEEAVRKLYAGPKGIRPFHWELEFPEVFRLDESGEPQGGFDVIVGNPPFLGGKRISTAVGQIYKEFLLSKQEGANGNVDLAARFFRQAFSIIRNDGTMGLISTNTVAQGDTRRGGLQWMCRNGGFIYRCTKRYFWPGDAAVVVSILHMSKGSCPEPRHLNGRTVSKITSFLFHAGGDDDPAVLSGNSGVSFIGYDIKGQGFLFDDGDPDATPISECTRLLSQNPDNRVILRPYISGDEINDSPIFATKRWVINFGERTLNECRRWPELLAIAEAKVRPERMEKSKELANWPWWQFWRTRNELADAIKNKSQILALSAVNSYLSLMRVPSEVIYSHAVVLLVIDTYAGFTILQSRVHELWARFFGSSMKDDLRYTPSDCFQTFPFPVPYESNATLEHVGKTYHEFRADLMVRNNEGLTRTYNRFHDPNEDSPDIVRLRELHAAMDQAVLDAYGWQDIQPVCEFIPEFDDEEEEDDDGRPKKKKYRYKWPEGIHDDVLARLLELNRQRALAEGQILILEQTTDNPWSNESQKFTKKRSRKSEAADSPATLFAATEEEE